MPESKDNSTLITLCNVYVKHNKQELQHQMLVHLRIGSLKTIEHEYIVVLFTKNVNWKYFF